MTAPADALVLPAAATREDLALAYGKGELITVAAAPGTVIGLGDVTRFLAIRRHNEHWCSPAMGANVADIPGDTLCLFLQRGRTVEVLLPLVHDGVQATLVGSPDGLRISGRADAEGGLALIAVGRASSAAALVPSVLAAVAEQFGRFRLRTAKKIPTWIDYFGWCTWDSFVPYRSVSADGVVDGLEAFAKAGMVPPLMILDDGWQDTDPPLSTHGGTLKSLGTVAERFPHGLAPVVAAAKTRGVKIFGVWHTLEGYWEGLQPDSKFADVYGAKSSGNGTPHPTLATPCTAIPPTHIAQFYHDYHRALADAGVDLVKVDNQGSLPRHLTGVAPPVASMRVYQEALQGSVAVHFDGNLLNCMGMDSLIFYAMPLSSVARNSEDYSPRAADSHGRHLVANAYNNLWTSALVVPDWDMFWSGGPTGAFHAAARALSGGPVYVSDEPGRFDRDVLKQLVVAGGRVLRPDRPALPAPDLLFRDPLTEDVPLVIHTVCGGVGTIAAFHCRSGDGMSASFSPAIIDDLAGDDFVVRLYRAGTVMRIRRAGAVATTLKERGFDIATVAQVIDGVAVLGSLTHYHGAGHVVRHVVTGQGVHVIDLRAGGRIGVWCATLPAAVLVDGKPLPAAKQGVDRKTGVLALTIPDGAAVRVELRFAVKTVAPTGNVGVAKRPVIAPPVVKKPTTKKPAKVVVRKPVKKSAKLSAKKR
jgi:raffinose synthase